MGGTSKCTGRLDVKHQGEWRPVSFLSFWSLKTSSAVCRQLGCGSAISIGTTGVFLLQRFWTVPSSCVVSGSSLKDCVIDSPLGVRNPRPGQVLNPPGLEVICSGNTNNRCDLFCPSNLNKRCIFLLYQSFFLSVYLWVYICMFESMSTVYTFF